MPLDSEEFKVFRETLQQSVLQFFKLNRFSAYSADELYFELGMLGVVTTPEMLRAELVQLVEQQRLLTAERDGAIYYWYDNRLGLPRLR
jgi:hypothetical protein